ncbi:hypothetical protein GCM10020221_31430 [Streptomyces thioluteus]|uniref:PspA-associated domain-containing protein n=1 Tax=Streptomyces thioluteus TaxID=66431 RepID=A0ABN3X0A4_STRTU
MIVRIMGEGQWKLADSHFTELNKLDDELLDEMESGDREGFRRTLGALLEAVRRLGSPLPDDALEPSELILPAPDASLEEVRQMLSDDGLQSPADTRPARPSRRPRRGARDVPPTDAMTTLAVSGFTRPQRWLRAHPVAANALLASGVFATMLIGALLGRDASRSPLAPGYVLLALLAAIALVARRRAPRLVLAVTSAFSVAPARRPPRTAPRRTQIATSAVVAL